MIKDKDAYYYCHSYYLSTCIIFVLPKHYLYLSLIGNKFKLIGTLIEILAIYVNVKKKYL